MPMASPLDIYAGLAPIDIPRYTLPEAAHHLRLPVNTVRSWITGRSYPSATGTRHSNPVIIPADKDAQLLSFGNLSELHVLSAFRKMHGIKLANIRSAAVFLRKHFNSDHPLIERDFMTDGKHLFVEHLGKVIDASEQGQIVFKWIKLYLERIDRDDSGRASRLYPFTANVEELSLRLVAIDPRINFGKPCIFG